MDHYSYLSDIDLFDRFLRELMPSKITISTTKEQHHINAIGTDSDGSDISMKSLWMARTGWTVAVQNTIDLMAR